MPSPLHCAASSVSARGRVRALSLAAAAGLSLAAASPSFAAVILVRASQDLPLAQQDGTTWTTAYQSLQKGLLVAVAGDEIRLAGGTYAPTAGADRTATFALKNGVTIRGGFLGNDGFPDFRNVWEFVTTLSGEIGNPSSIADNSFHVVTAASVNTSAILEGVVIAGGNANGAGNDGIGGGMLVNGASPLVVRCLFRDNHATKGAGIGRLSGITAASGLLISDSVFDANVASQGAAIFAQTSPVQLFCSTVRDNVSAAAVDLTGIAGTSTFSSVILYGNTGGATTEESQFRITGAPLVVTRSCIEGWNNVAPSSPTTIASNPMFLYPAGAIITITNRYRLRGDSPCIDQGECGIADSADLDGDGLTSEILSRDFTDDLRQIDDLLSPNGGAPTGGLADMGACEHHRPRTVLVNHAATGANNGTTWTDAYVLLQSAIAELAALPPGETPEIWVAQGTYKPTTGSDPLASFVPPPNTSILGGFVGGERSRSLRNWRTHPTILSGELGPAGPAGNSRHVVRFTGGSSLIDGFVIRDGAAIASEGGGGVRADAGASARIYHCVITANTGDGPGSGVACVGGNGDLVLLGYTAVVGNSATGGGIAGLVFGGTASNRLERCLIAGNVSASPSVPGGAQFNGVSGGTSVFVKTVVIAANQAGGSSAFTAQCTTNGFPVVFDHCAMQNYAGPPAGVNANGTFATDATGGMIDANGPDNVYGTLDDNYVPAPCSDLLDAGPLTVGLGELLVDLNDNGFFDFKLDDLYGQPAPIDLPIANAPSSTVIDIGVAEAQIASAGSPDLNGDGIVDASDLALLLGAWNTVSSTFDLTSDCVVDAADLAVLLGAWD